MFAKSSITITSAHIQCFHVNIIWSVDVNSSVFLPAKRICGVWEVEFTSEWAETQTVQPFAGGYAEETGLNAPTVSKKDRFIRFLPHLLKITARFFPSMLSKTKAAAHVRHTADMDYFIRCDIKACAALHKSHLLVMSDVTWPAGQGSNAIDVYPELYWLKYIHREGGVRCAIPVMKETAWLVLNFCLVTTSSQGCFCKFFKNFKFFNVN